MTAGPETSLRGPAKGCAFRGVPEAEDTGSKRNVFPLGLGSQGMPVLTRPPASQYHCRKMSSLTQQSTAPLAHVLDDVAVSSVDLARPGVLGPDHATPAPNPVLPLSFSLRGRVSQLLDVAHGRLAE